MSFHTFICHFLSLPFFKDVDCGSFYYITFICFLINAFNHYFFYILDTCTYKGQNELLLILGIVFGLQSKFVQTNEIKANIIVL